MENISDWLPLLLMIALIVLPFLLIGRLIIAIIRWLERH